MLRSCDARVKLAVALGALALALAARRPAVPLMLCAFAAASLALAGGRAELRRLVTPFSGLLVTAGVPAALVAWYGGAAAGVAVGARVLGATSVSFWLLRSTTIASLQSALFALAVPGALVELVGLAHRYVAVFRETLSTARDAQTLRLGYATTRRALRSVGVLTGVVFARAIDQTETLAQAMMLRGYRGELPVAPPSPLGRRDALVAALGALALAASWSAPW